MIEIQGKHKKDCFAVSMGRLKHETIYSYYREIT